jgi:DNA polymerase-3 subunit delta'
MTMLAPISTWPTENSELHALYRRLMQSEVPHTMLFVGSTDDTQKLTEFLAKLLLCEGENIPCGQCASCQQMTEGNQPDFFEIDGVSAGAVKTGQVEALQERLNHRTHNGGRMVYRILGVDRITSVAANRLLKTLEEPLSGTIALLTAQSIQRILPTIRSRCFIYHLQPKDTELMWDDPLPVKLDEVNSDGESELFATFLKPMVQWTQELLMSAEMPLVLADSLIKLCSDIDLSDALHVLSVWLRDILHYSTNQNRYIRFSDRAADLRKQSRMVSAGQLTQMIDVIIDTRSRIQAHVVANLNVEQMCIRLREVLRSV